MTDQRFLFPVDAAPVVDSLPSIENRLIRASAGTGQDLSVDESILASPAVGGCARNKFLPRRSPVKLRARSWIAL